MTLVPKFVVPFIWARTNDVMTSYIEYEKLMMYRGCTEDDH